MSSATLFHTRSVLELLRSVGVPASYDTNRPRSVLAVTSFLSFPLRPGLGGPAATTAHGRTPITATGTGATPEAHCAG